MDTVTLWEKIKRGLQDGATSAAAKAESLGKLGRARLDVARDRHAIHEAFAELGGLTYEQLAKDEAALARTPVPVQEQVAKLKTLELRLKDHEEKLEVVKTTGESS